MGCILKVRRLFPAGSIAPQGMPYINMEEAINKYCDSNVSMSYNHAYVYMNMGLIPELNEKDTKVIGVVAITTTTHFYIRFSDKAAYNFISAHIRDAAIRVLSECSTNDSEYGVRVNKIIRFEIDIIPEEEI